MLKWKRSEQLEKLEMEIQAYQSGGLVVIACQIWTQTQPEEMHCKLKDMKLENK